MSKYYILPWFGNWFWPDNIGLYWFSTYDRTDMMAQTFADNLFYNSIVGRDL
jgi:NTE family protein